MALLRADLVALEGEAWVEPPEARWTVPPAGHLDGVIGRLYVLEGSRLGGRLIGRCLRASLGLDGRTGARFFADDEPPDRSPAAWLAFWRWALQHAQDEEAIIAAALDAYTGCAERLDRLLRRLGEAGETAP